MSRATISAAQMQNDAGTSTAQEAGDSTHKQRKPDLMGGRSQISLSIW